MPPRRKTQSFRLGEALADLVREALDTLLPAPEPRPIPVRVKERR